MKHGFLAAFALVFLLALPLQASAVELSIRNEEQCAARVALAYLRGDWFVVEGWFRLAPNQVETVTLHGVDEKDVYIHVAFDDPEIKQFVAKQWKVECQVAGTDFRYALPAVGGKPDINGPDTRKAAFYVITALYKMGDGKLWFSLTSAAG